MSNPGEIPNQNNFDHNTSPYSYGDLVDPGTEVAQVVPEAPTEPIYGQPAEQAGPGVSSEAVQDGPEQPVPNPEPTPGPSEAVGTGSAQTKESRAPLTLEQQLFSALNPPREKRWTEPEIGIMKVRTRSERSGGMVTLAARTVTEKLHDYENYRAEQRAKGVNPEPTNNTLIGKLVAASKEVPELGYAPTGTNATRDFLDRAKELKDLRSGNSVVDNYLDKLTMQATIFKKYVRERATPTEWGESNALGEAKRIENGERAARRLFSSINDLRNELTGQDPGNRNSGLSNEEKQAIHAIKEAAKTGNMRFLAPLVELVQAKNELTAALNSDSPYDGIKVDNPKDLAATRLRAIMNGRPEDYVPIYDGNPKPAIELSYAENEIIKRLSDAYKHAGSQKFTPLDDGARSQMVLAQNLLDAKAMDEVIGGKPADAAPYKKARIGTEGEERGPSRIYKELIRPNALAMGMSRDAITYFLEDPSACSSLMVLINGAARSKMNGMLTVAEKPTPEVRPPAPETNEAAGRDRRKRAGGWAGRIFGRNGRI